MTHFSPRTAVRYQPRVLRPGMAPIPRCCAVHPDWPTLAQHLLNDFPTATISQVVQEMRTARDQVDPIGLAAADALLIAELKVRHRLLGLDAAGDPADTIQLPEY